MPRSVDLDDYPHVGTAGNPPRVPLAPGFDRHAAGWRDTVVWSGGRLSVLALPARPDDRADDPRDRPREPPRTPAPE